MTKARRDRSGILNGPGLSILVFGCSHARDNESFDDFDRFSAIGKMAHDFKVDAVVNTGDTSDYPSLRAWRGSKLAGGSGGTKSMENGRVLKDRMAGLEARKMIMAEYRRQLAQHKRNGHPERIWQPRWIEPLGNHDESEDLAVEKNPDLEGLLGSQFTIDPAREMGWEITRHKKQISGLQYPQVGGVFFGHFYPSGSMGRAIAVKTVLNETCKSFVFSHSHKMGYAHKRILGGENIHALNIGCYQPPHRLRAGEWSGAFILSNVRGGDFTFNQFSYDWILRNYGTGGYAQELRAQAAVEARELEDARAI